MEVIFSFKIFLFMKILDFKIASLSQKFKRNKRENIQSICHEAIFSQKLTKFKFHIFFIATKGRSTM